MNENLKSSFFFFDEDLKSSYPLNKSTKYIKQEAQGFSNSKFEEGDITILIFMQSIQRP